MHHFGHEQALFLQFFLKIHVFSCTFEAFKSATATMNFQKKNVNRDNIHAPNGALLVFFILTALRRRAWPVCLLQNSQNAIFLLVQVCAQADIVLHLHAQESALCSCTFVSLRTMFLCHFFHHTSHSISTTPATSNKAVTAQFTSRLRF